jgi:hypothetical protein
MYSGSSVRSYLILSVALALHAPTENLEAPLDYYYYYYIPTYENFPLHQKTDLLTQEPIVRGYQESIQLSGAYDTRQTS